MARGERERRGIARQPGDESAEAVASRASVDRQIRDELAAHFEMLVAEGIERGLSPERAELEARRRFGDVRRYSREARAIRLRRLRAAARLERWAGILHDLRSAYRTLRSRPAFVAAAVIMLAIGIGVTTALFSVVDAVLLRPLPFERPEELYVISGAPVTISEGVTSPDDVLNWRTRVSGAFVDLAAYYPFGKSANVTSTADPVRARATEVSENFFEVLRPRMVAGRAFGTAEAIGDRRLAVISEAFWRGALVGDPEIVGATIHINGLEYRVLGIVPSHARLPAEADVWVPMAYTYEELVVVGARFFTVLGRARTGVSRETVDAEVATMRAWLGEQFMQTSYDRDLEAISLMETVVSSVRTPLWLLLAATVLVLVVANANLANFMLSRARWRQREYAVRNALGAGNRRLVQQALGESLLLAGAGGALGGLIAAWGLGLIRAIEDLSLPRSAAVGVDWTMFGFALLLALVSAVAIGILPALAVLRPDLSSALRASRVGAPGGGHNRPRDTLLVLQVAVALVLALGAGLLTRTYVELQRVETGFSRDSLTFALTLDRHSYDAWSDVEIFTTSLVDELERLPGVRGAGAGNLLPLADASFFGLLFHVEGTPDTERFAATYLSVTPGYLEALGLNPTRGRTIAAEDTHEAPFVGVVNEAFVRQHLAGAPAVGTRLAQIGSDNLIEIVGVVADVHRTGMRDEPQPELYLPMAQARTRPNYFALALDGLPGDLVDGLYAAVRRVDPEQPIFDIRSMDDRIAGSLVRPRLLAWLFGCFAVAGVALAAFGLYATVHHWIAARTYEIGVRMAVGADRWSVLGLFLRQGAVRLGMGMAFGLAAYALAARAVDETLLFGVGPGDPGTLALAAAAMGGVALMAIFVASARAAGLDPVRALRAE